MSPRSEVSELAPADFGEAPDGAEAGPTHDGDAAGPTDPSRDRWGDSDNEDLVPVRNTMSQEHRFPEDIRANDLAVAAAQRRQ